jgi:hypothetical protein
VKDEENTLTDIFISLTLLSILIGITIAAFCAHLVLKPTSFQTIP